MPMELVNQLPYNHPYRWDGTLFGGPKLWRPSELGASLALWLDAEDTASITLNVNKVSQWNDKSGNGRNATQATAANQPTYVSPGVQFGGGFQNLAISVPYSGVLSFFMVATPSSAPCYYVGRAQFQGGGPTILGNFSGTSIEYYNSADRATFSASPTSTFLVSYTQQLSGRIIGFYNGSSAFNIAQTDNQNPGVSWSTIGNAFREAWSNGVTGTMFEIILVSTVLDDGNRQRMEGYLAWKRGLQGNLPAGHPYKNTPPTV